MRTADILTLTPAGLYCTAGDFLKTIKKRKRRRFKKKKDKKIS